MAQVKDVLETYPLSRDFLDFNRHVNPPGACLDSRLYERRLNLQHYLWKDIFGYNIHPKILQHRGLLKVADVGAGTGYVAD
jgi:hypothetical protein